eukprot:m.309297 g.309297  ORF g.309297 m.309297 type:complete len:463 (+) comp46019_c0_seq1:90-1478(+)
MSSSSNLQLVKESYEAAWARSEEIFSMITDDGLCQKPIQLRNPFIFYRGHVAGFTSIHVNQKLLGKPPFSPNYDQIFERGLDPDVFDPSCCHDHSTVPTEWPPIAKVVDYVKKCRKEVLLSLEAVQKADLDDETKMSRWSRGGRVHRMCVEHEMLHQETMMYMYLEMDAKYKLECPLKGAAVSFQLGVKARPTKVVAIPAGKVCMGADFDRIPYGWDNEFSSHVVDIPAFQVDDLPVTNGDFLKFVQSGAYEQEAYWDKAAWSWKAKNELKQPNAWKKADGNFFVKTLFNKDIPLNDAASWPVFVSLSEAQAYACWKGRRLLTEAEWCRTAFTSVDDEQREFPWGNEKPTAEHGNFNWKNMAPMPVGSHPQGTSGWGVQDLIGDAWEWTSTPFRPYDGFEAMDCYPGYSADFFGGNDYECTHYVLKGGSFACSVDLIRSSFRNWFQSCYPFVWAKFRLANDA